MRPLPEPPFYASFGGLLYTVIVCKGKITEYFNVLLLLLHHYDTVIVILHNDIMYRAPTRCCIVEYFSLYQGRVISGPPDVEGL